MELHLLAVGDIVSEAGLDFLTRRLRPLKKKYDVHFTVVNGENADRVGADPRPGGGHLGRGGRCDHLGQPHLEPDADRPGAG